MKKFNQLSEANKELIYATACFTIAVVASLAHQFLCTEPRNIALFDSRNYLETTKLLYHLIQNFAKEPLGDPLSNINVQYLAKRLVWDGPTLPMIPAIVFFVLGREPSPLHWPALSCIQSVYHGLTTGIIYFLGKDISKSKNAGILVALSWALYPSAIISSGRFLTEGFSALLVVSTIYYMYRVITDGASSTKSIFGQSIVCGILQALLFLTKPILAPACLTANFVIAIFLKSSSPITRLLIVAIGIGLGAASTVGPWMIVTKELTGKTLVAPSRFPLTNLTIGSNWESDGWETFPQSKIHSLYCQDEKPSDKELLLPTFLSMVATHPKKLAGLTLRKLNRIFLEPWNGCSNTVFGVTLGMQRKLHLAVILLGILGILSLASGVRNQPSSDPELTEAQRKVAPSMVIGVLCLTFLAGHLVYLPFQAMARYGFTSIPCMFLLSAFFCSWALRTFKTTELLAICLSGIALVSIESFDFLPYTVSMAGSLDEAAFLEFAIYSVILSLFLLLARNMFLKYLSKSQLGNGTFLVLWLLGISTIYANATHAISSNEWKCDLKPSDIALRRVFIPAQPRKERTKAFLLVDCNEAINKCDVTVNGYTLETELKPVFDISPANFWVYKTMRDCTAMKQIAFDDIRKWRIASIPIEKLRPGEFNSIAIKSTNGAVRLYGDYESNYANRRAIPELLSFSPPLLYQNLVKNEGRVRSAIGAKIKRQSCQLILYGKSKSSQDLSRDHGMQTGEFRIFILTAYDDTKCAIKQNPAPPWEREITVSDFNAYLNPEAYTGIPNSGGKMLQINSKILKLAPSISTILYPTEDLVEQLKSSTQVLVKLTGSAKSNKNTPCRFGPAVFLNGEDSSLVLPALPNFVLAPTEWTSFKISQSIPVAAIPGGLKSVTLALFPGPWEQVMEYGTVGERGDALVKDMKLSLTPCYEPLFPADHGYVLH